MTDTEFVLTDPARELVEMLEMLQAPDSSSTGAEYLANKFGVKAWSQDFHKIIAAIMDRLAQLSEIVSDLTLDDDFRSEMLAHINDIAVAFGPGAFQNAWRSYGIDRLSRQNLQPLKGLSGQVRQKIAYRKLSDGEIDELLTSVAELISWLKEHQIVEQDFIRQALIEGLEGLQFRLKRLKWVGWGYALEGLRDVIAAYMLLERQELKVNENPDAEAALRKVGALIKDVYGKLQTVKTVAETGDWILKAYGAATLVLQGTATIKGLLTAS